MKLNTQVTPGHIVLDGDPALPLQKGHKPQFSAHVCCIQTTGWIKMSLGMKVGLDPGHIDPKRGTAPNLQPMSIMAERSPISVTAEQAHLFYFAINYTSLAPGIVSSDAKNTQGKFHIMANLTNQISFIDVIQWSKISTI